MLCVDFEDQLTDYLEGTLASAMNRACAEHALRCPVCHDLLSEVKNAIHACRTTEVPAPRRLPELEARILQQTMPGSQMSCDEFEDYLTDYLDGFLPAPLYHRWQRHAYLCARCTELPGSVVRSIGACYSYIKEEMPVPAGLHDRILEATLGTTDVRRVRSSFGARLATRLRQWLDSAVSPQLATVATMVLFAVLVGTSTISDDGSIGGMYRASLRLAAQTYVRGATTAARSGATLPRDLKRLAENWENLIDASPRGETGDQTEDQNPPQTNGQEKSNEAKP